MRLTYLELLEAVKEGKQPKKVKVGSVVYSWDGCEYVQNTDSRQSLSDRLPNWTTKAQTTADFIEEVVDILTGEEKDWIKSVIAPFRNHVTEICKTGYRRAGVEDVEFIYIDYSTGTEEGSVIFPNFKKGEKFKEMEIDRGYTPEELDL